MSFENLNYTELIERLSEIDVISARDSFILAKRCSKDLRNKEKEHEARDLIIRVLDVIDKIESSSKPIWNDLTEAAGLYPYVDPNGLSNSALLRYEYHKSPFLEGVYLHEEQHKLSLDLLSNKSVVVSAPTSFGKSLLIEEIIASRKYKNMVIIQPTLALLDETRKKLHKYRDSYKVIVSTNQEPSSEIGNIFLFTGERVVEYEKMPDIEFFVIDEFYKLSLDRDDDRAIVLNQAFHKLLKMTNKFYLLGPMVKNIPMSFKERFEFVWFPTDFATVAVDEKSFEIIEKKKAKEKRELKKQELYQLLEITEEPTLIYCSSPHRSTEVALDFIKFLQDRGISRFENNIQEIAEMNEWIEKNINSSWALIDALNNSIAIHHGALPRHLGSSIVDAFNNGSIKFLFCTATLIG